MGNSERKRPTVGMTYEEFKLTLLLLRWRVTRTPRVNIFVAPGGSNKGRAYVWEHRKSEVTLSLNSEEPEEFSYEKALELINKEFSNEL